MCVRARCRSVRLHRALSVGGCALGWAGSEEICRDPLTEREVCFVGSTLSQATRGREVARLGKHVCAVLSPMHPNESCSRFLGSLHYAAVESRLFATADLGKQMPAAGERGRRGMGWTHAADYVCTGLKYSLLRMRSKSWICCRGVQSRSDKQGIPDEDSRRGDRYG